MPTPEELSNLSAACNHLWELDHNRLVPGRDYEINLQHSTRAYTVTDQAPEPLFNFVNEDVFRRPTYKAFIDLLDNYERETGVAETVTTEERRENMRFIEAIMRTAPMQFAKNYLQRKKLAPRDDREFKRVLHNVWFELYKREVQNDSSGFEHVFVGEEKNGKIIGFHNWIQFYREERKGLVDYKGYILPRRSRGRQADHPDGHEQLITLQFSWTDADDGSDDIKSLSSTLIGVSPEFEVAMYTLCFLAGHEDNHITVGEYDINIKCYKINSRNGPKLGTSYPEALN